jgi:hypothetical protein
MEPRKMVIAMPKIYWAELESYADSNGMMIDEAIYEILSSEIDEWLAFEQMVKEVEKDAT